jgi:hypothetical protein
MNENLTRQVILNMPIDELRALAQFVKRIDYDTCVKFASARTAYGRRCEGDVIWSAVNLLRAGLADAGFAPR